jgi:putative addiction module component (TIGR02574 family)
MSSTLTNLGIDKMTRDERIALVQVIWDSVAFDDDAPELSENQRKELQRRVDELDADPTNVLTWEEIKAREIEWRNQSVSSTTR